jgi:hypothetical protein
MYRAKIFRQRTIQVVRLPQAAGQLPKGCESLPHKDAAQNFPVWKKTDVTQVRTATCQGRASTSAEVSQLASEVIGAHKDQAAEMPQSPIHA